jgi:hypothetical protein
MKTQAQASDLFEVAAGILFGRESAQPGPTQSYASTTQSDSAPDEHRLVILVEELEQSFRELARESGRLRRLVQPRKKCVFPAEGFNYLVAQRMEGVHSAFQTYTRRREQLLNYIKATAWMGRQEQEVDRTTRFKIS